MDKVMDEIRSARASGDRRPGVVPRRFRTGRRHDPFEAAALNGLEEMRTGNGAVAAAESPFFPARSRSSAAMSDEQPSFKHYSTMPLWAKLALIAAVIAVGVAIALIG